MRWLAAIALVTACGFRPTTAVPDDGRATDGSGPADTSDGQVTPHDGATCYGTGLGVHVCLVTPPTSPFDVSGVTTIDTAAGSTDCAATIGVNTTSYCVVAGTSITIDGFLSASGSRALLLLSLSTLDVSGTIDVASHKNGSPQSVGAGGNSTTCGGTAASQSGSGGFGGSFGSKGGNGGSTAPPDGKSGAVIVPTTLRGGCAGGIGLDMTLTGVVGNGGGAVDLIAVTAITAFGEINASGSGGGGASPTSNGGSGGGSGGLIAFDAPALSFNSTTVIFANGGGGGGASDSGMNTAGTDGTDPSNFNSGGGGGPGGSSGGAGGDGAKYSSDATDGVDGGNNGGNGGGGGGQGVIRVFQSPIPVGGHVTPTPS